MRIHPSISWVLLGTIFTFAAAQEPQKFQFDKESFRGELLKETQSSVFKYETIAAGRTFTWNQNGPEVGIVRVDLMKDDNQSILSWCPNNGCDTTAGFGVDLRYPTAEIYLGSGVLPTLEQFLNVVLFFRIDWRNENGKRDTQKQSAYSQKWAIVDDDASQIYSSNSLEMTAGASAARPPGLAQTDSTSAISSTASYSTSAYTTSTSTMSSAAATTEKSGTSRGLTTGAIVGIVVGCVGGLILISLVAGCFCLRRRRRDAGGDRGGNRGVKDTITEKEARASILDRDQPDTPYSEQNSQHPLHRGLGLAGRNGSGADLGIGQAMSGERSTESIHTVADVNDRNSGVYSSLGGAAACSAHGTPVIGSGAFASGPSSPLMQPHTPSISVHERSPAMGSSVPRSSSQLDRSLSPYRDNNAGQHDYGQHHAIGDGADRAHQEQEHSGDDTARAPSSLYSSNPLEEAQPISPGSPKDNGGVAGGASSQPQGHSRTNTPSGIAQQYAHLVEDGMTDAEIRRLEEEERALDEAIEQAGSTGRQR